MQKIGLRSFSMKHSYLYKECFFPIENQGLVLIRGLNLDDGGYLGAGKSTMFDAVSRILFGRGGKQDKVSDAVNPYIGQDLEQSLSFDLNDHPYEVRHYRNHSHYGTAFQVIDLETGRDVLPSRARKHPQKWIRDELLRIDETTVFSTMYLTQEFNHVLLDGKPAERRQKFTVMFGLDIYDSFAEQFKQREKLLASDLQKLSISRQRRRELKKELSNSPDLKKLKRRAEKAANRLAAVEAGLWVSTKELEKQQQLLAGIKLSYNLQIEKDSLWERSSALQRRFSSPDEVTAKVLRKAESRLEKLTLRRAKISQKVEAAKRREIILSQLDGLEDQIKEAGGIEDCESRLLDIKTRLHFLTTSELSTAEKKKEIGQSLHSLPEIPKDLEELKHEDSDLQRKVGKAEDRIRTVSDQLSHGICSECKRPFDMDEEDVQRLKSELSDLRADLKTWRKRQYRLKGILDSAAKVERLSQQLEDLGESRTPEEILKEISQLVKEEKKLSRLVELSRQKEKLEGQLSGISAKSSDALLALEKTLAGKHQDLKHFVKGCRRLVDLNHQLRDLPTGDKKKVSAAVKELRLEIRGFNHKLRTHNKKVATLGAEVSSLEDLHDEYRALRKQLKGKRKLQDTVTSLAALRVAFGPKGMKQERFRSILTEATDTTIPAYTNLLWPEKTVRLALDDSDGIDFFLKRRGEKRTTRSTLLSGGEKHKAALAFLLGMRDMKELYSGCSFNCLFIDEPFGNLDPQGELAFLNVLEILKERFESIFVISHRPEVIHSSVWDQTWWVIRQKNQSRLYTEEPPMKYQKLANSFMTTDGAM